MPFASRRFSNFDPSRDCDTALTGRARTVLRTAAALVVACGLGAPALADPAPAPGGALWSEDAATAPAADQPAPQPGPFAGAWSAQVTPAVTGAPVAGDADAPAGFGDALLFHAGQLSAEACATVGFAPAAYTLATYGGVTHFEATLTSDAHGTMTWTGRAGGRGLVGEVRWAKPDGRVVTYALDARRPDYAPDDTALADAT